MNTETLLLKTIRGAAMNMSRNNDGFFPGQPSAYGEIYYALRNPETVTLVRNEYGQVTINGHYFSNECQLDINMPIPPKQYSKVYHEEVENFAELCNVYEMF